FDLLVPVFARPRVERRPGDFIHDGDGDAEASQVDAFEVVAARVACLDALVIEYRRMKISELALVFLSAVRAEHTSKRPRREAGAALKGAPAAVERRIDRASKHRELWCAGAKRAPVVRVRKAAADWRDTLLRQPLRV